MTHQIVLPTESSLTTETPTSKNPAAVYLAGLSSKRSRRVMENALRTIAAILMDVDPKTLSYDDVLAIQWQSLRYEHTRAIRSALQERYSFSSVNRMLSALRQILKSSWRLGYIDAETYQRAADIENVKGETVIAGRDLPQGEILSLVTDCNADSNDKAGIRDAAIIGILYTCALRRAELTSLTLNNVDIETGKIIVTGKGNKQRTVYATNGTLAALQDWLTIRGTETAETNSLFVPVNRGGKVIFKGMTSQAIYKMLKKRAASAGVKDFSPHDFRRTFAGDMLDRGVDIVTVQKLMGHATVTTTGRYDRRGEEVKRKAVEKLHFPYQKRRLV